MKMFTIAKKCSKDLYVKIILVKQIARLAKVSNDNWLYTCNSMLLQASIHVQVTRAWTQALVLPVETHTPAAVWQVIPGLNVAIQVEINDVNEPFQTQ